MYLQRVGSQTLQICRQLPRQNRRLKVTRLTANAENPNAIANRSLAVFGMANRFPPTAPGSFAVRGPDVVHGVACHGREAEGRALETVRVDFGGD